jgi:hypothetical protein
MRLSVKLALRQTASRNKRKKNAYKTQTIKLKEK